MRPPAPGPSPAEDLEHPEDPEDLEHPDDLEHPEGGPGRVGRRAFLVAGTAAVMLAVGGTVLGVRLAGGGGAGTPPMPMDTGTVDLATLPAPIARHYRFAASHEELLSGLPCYCGCEEFLDHRNLYDCFVRADGSGWEAHAAGCAVCNAEAELAVQRTRAGDTIAEVRAAIVAQFGETIITAPPTA